MLGWRREKPWRDSLAARKTLARTVLGLLSVLLAVDARSAHNWHGDLGVVKVPTLHASARDKATGKNFTVSLTVWLRRIGGTKVSYGLPHQAQEAIRALVWVDYAEDLHLRKYGHVLLPVDPTDWQPSLLLETPVPGRVLSARIESGHEILKQVNDPKLRPYSFRFDLPPDAADWSCFKVLEASFPLHKAPICFSPETDPSGAIDPAGTTNTASSSSGAGGSSGNGRSSVCSVLAPSTLYHDTAPALWAAIGPVRHYAPTYDWADFYDEIAPRVAHYLSYHTELGYAGLLLYADRLVRHYLRRHPATAAYLRSGHLRFVAWDMPERSHDINDLYSQRGATANETRPLGYNWDQALFASHALLGLSACGTNLMLLITDFDEFAYTPNRDMKWPAPLTACMRDTSSGASPGAASGAQGSRRALLQHQPQALEQQEQQQRQAAGTTMFTLQRYDILSSTVPPGVESKLWSTILESLPSTHIRHRSLLRGAGGGGGGGSQGSRLRMQGGGRRLLQKEEEEAYSAGAEPLQGPCDAAKAIGAVPSGTALRKPAEAVSGKPPHPLSFHPMVWYDRRARDPMSSLHNKLILYPAAEVISFFVHDGVPRFGGRQVVGVECMVLLHVPNYWGPRTTSAINYNFNGTDVVPLRNWLLDGAEACSSS